MAHIPQSVLEKQPTLPGLELRSRGKVRDSYDIPLRNHPETPAMLVVASDRCSIFDFVLPTLIPLKGAVLTALNHFWGVEVVSRICGGDQIACGKEAMSYLPNHLRDDIDLQQRATLVEIVPAPDVEDIVRLYLTGSGWASYQKTNTVCGHRLPPGLTDGSKLPYPIYTPTTKASEGHDEHITADSVAEKYGPLRERRSLQVAGAMSAYAEKRGIILADTKFEFSFVDGKFILADEKGTSDSSRFWDATEWKKAHAKGKLPPSFDKQYVREWGKKACIEKDESGGKREPTDKDDLAFVDTQIVPEEVVRMTTLLYRYIFWRLTGKQIEVYQHDEMDIAVKPPRRKIEVLVGSENDLSQIKAGLGWLEYSRNADVNVSVMSCHRNTEELREFVADRLICVDAVIAGAGMAAALPGIVKSHLCARKHPEIPVIGVAFESKTAKDNKAAILSIECLPGAPVELDPNGNAYFGSEGFMKACQAAVEHEFLPKKIVAKPVQLAVSV